MKHSACRGGAVEEGKREDEEADSEARLVYQLFICVASYTSCPYIWSHIPAVHTFGRIYQLSIYLPAVYIFAGAQRSRRGGDRTRRRTARQDATSNISRCT